MILYRVLLLAVFCVSTQTLSARVIRVCDACPMRSLKEAIGAAAPFDTIEVESGVYKEGRIDIFKPLRILGINHPVIDGEGKGHVIYVDSADVTLEGLLVQNSGTSDLEEFAGIYVEHSERCRIIGNHLKKNTYGVYISNSSHCIVQDNQISGAHDQELTAGNGVHLFHADHIEILSNEVLLHRDGLYFEFSEDLKIRQNRVHGNLRYGMHFMFSHNNTFEQNVFQDNATGCAIMYSRGLKVTQNLFEKSVGLAAYGLLLKDIEGSNFQKNVFAGNTVGIYMEGATRNTFEANQIRKNGWAVRILGSADENSFKGNTFADNVFDVATNSRDSLNTFEGNFWSRYSGYDLDGNGVGDVPYRPVAIFGYWVNQYAVLIMLLSAPVIEFLEVAERVLPVITPVDLKDASPLLHPPA